MYVNKWAGFSVSVVCTCSAGLAYCFSLYSNQLKEAFGYDQRQIQAIGSATNLGGYASIISGLVYDSMLGWDGRGPRQDLFRKQNGAIPAYACLDGASLQLT